MKGWLEERVSRFGVGGCLRWLGSRDILEREWGVSLSMGDGPGGLKTPGDAPRQQTISTELNY